MCGCFDTERRLTHDNIPINLNPEDYLQHVNSYHSGRNQQNSTHFIAIHNNAIRIEKHLNIPESYFNEPINKF